MSKLDARVAIGEVDTCLHQALDALEADAFEDAIDVLEDAAGAIEDAMEKIMALRDAAEKPS